MAKQKGFNQPRTKVATCQKKPAISPKSQQDKSITLICGAEAHASACTPKETAVLHGSNVADAEPRASACMPKQNAAPQGSDAETAEATGQKGPGKPQKLRSCTFCPVPVKYPIVRCKPCNAVYNRILHYKNDTDDGGAAWDNMDRTKKVALIREARGLTGPKVKNLLRQYITKELQSQLTSLAGLFLDSPDLRSKYQSKPKQFKALRKNANKFISLVQGCDLHQDRERKSSSDAEEARGEKRRMDPTPEELIRTTKKQTGAEKATVASGWDTTTTLDEKHAKQVNEWMQFLYTSQAGIETLNANIRVLDKQIPPDRHWELDYILLLYQRNKEDCHQILDTGKYLNFHELVTKMARFKDVFERGTTFIEKQMKAAKAISSDESKPKAKRGGNAAKKK